MLLIFDNLPHSDDTCNSLGRGYDKNGKLYITSGGLTYNINFAVTRRNRTMINDLNSPVGYVRLLWAKPNSSEYTKAIEVINDCYRKMLMIGKCREVFRDKVSDLLTAKPSKISRLQRTILNKDMLDI